MIGLNLLEKKRCPECRRALPFAVFYRDPGMKDGRQAKCRTCSGAEIRKAEIRRYADRKARGLCVKCSARARADEIHCPQCAEKNRATQARYATQLHRRIAKLLAIIRIRARRAGVPFALEVEDVLPLVMTHCPIFGVQLNYYNTKARDDSASLDRLVPALGYVRANVAFMSQRANTLKGNGTAEEHRRIADYMDKMGGASAAAVKQGRKSA